VNQELSANLTLSHYRIVSKLGAGGMGEVWLAEDTRLKRKVAIKLLPAELTSDADRVRRFEQEAQAASALNHPNIITVYDIGENEAGRFIVMEMVAGRTLRDVIAQDNSVETLLSLGTQIAKALSAAHAAGITHRDIKPDNIMVRDDGYVKVLDFGLARLVPTGSGEDAATPAQQTTPGTIMGTVAYMSPEQAGGQSVSPASDIFALGIVLYEMATRRNPFRADTLVGYLHAITLQTPPPPSQLRPDIPTALSPLILRMLDKDAARRPTAGEVAQTLQEIERRTEKQQSESATLILSPSHHLAASPSPPRHTVGRDNERRELGAGFAAARGRGALLCVAGEPGIGKTTLVEDFLADLAAEGRSTVARGRCSERLAGTEAYLPLLDALESLSKSDKSLAQTMEQIAPTWYAQIVPLSGESEETTRLLAELRAASQERMKRELANFLHAVAQTQPLVIFFDDLQWADVSTIDLLSFLARRLETLKVFIIVTYRPSDMLVSKHPFLQIKPDLQARGVCRELLLEFLSEAEIAEYLKLEFPIHRFPNEFPQLIHAKTEGSPLFMADLVRYLRDRNVIAQSNSAWTLAQALPEIERELPESVRAMIERKIAQISEEDRKLLTTASVQGYEFDSAVVAQVLNLDADEVEERLEKLERVFAFVKLVSEVEFPNRTLTLRYRFIHVLYQNALYASLRPTRKASLSASVAHSLEGFHGSDSTGVANELALLWEAARDYERAADCFLRAARHASKTFAHHEAVKLSRHGLAVLGNLPEGPDRVRRELDLQLVLGPAVMITKGWAAPEVETIYLRARENCQKLGDNARLFPVMAGLWNYYLVLADYAQARKLGEELLVLAGAAQDPPSLVAAHWALVEASFWTGDFDTTESHCQQLVNLYDDDRDCSLALVYGQDPLVICNAYHATLLLLTGYPEQAFSRLEKSRARAEELGYPFDLGITLFWAAQFYLIGNDPERTQKEAAAATALSQEHGFALILSLAEFYRGWALAHRGELEAGIAGMTNGKTALRATGAKVYGSFAEALLAEALGRAGRMEAAERLIDEAISLAESKNERFFEAEVHRIKGELLRLGGATESEVTACFRHAIQISRQQRAKLLELRATTSLSLWWQQHGKIAEAREILAGIYCWFSEGLDTEDLKEAKALLDELGWTSR
jgi:serine/threonine protein kinase/predicted ATPase